AYAYCVWAELELPREARWQYAAQGPDGRTYPWGNDAPDAGGMNRANYDPGVDEADGHAYAAPVGSYGPGAPAPRADGSSPFGALDTAGNVWEWTNDWYSGTGPDRVYRGGGFLSAVTAYLRAASRYSSAPDDRVRSMGFRVSR
ncbi:MAG: SUMF1/EgtB/PvdO family nonheme iron enzyme, partial [Candidatus Riflebacteria bacterium]|nr:SUMF1/EgtB/PvdO family nonheme iron enzyme [Candidatus Riflebacteria bacterium]